MKLQVHWRALQQPDEEGAEWMHGRRITFVQVMNDEERDWPLRPRQQPKHRPMSIGKQRRRREPPKQKLARLTKRMGSLCSLPWCFKEPNL